MSKFVPVISAAVMGFKYDRESRRLFAQFAEDVYYSYEDVPGDVVLDTLFADSIGQAFDALVKKGGFEYTRIPPDEALA